MHDNTTDRRGMSDEERIARLEVQAVELRELAERIIGLLDGQKVPE